MKIKSIASLCKFTGTLVIHNKIGEYGDIVKQYINNGYGIYPLMGLLGMNEDNMLDIFDIPVKTRSAIRTSTKSFKEDIILDDTDPNEYVLESSDIVIEYGGEKLKCFFAEDEILFINIRYLQPFSDVFDVVEYYARKTKDGHTVVCAKAGFLLQAVIKPVNIINEQFISALEEITEACRQTKFNMDITRHIQNHEEEHNEPRLKD